MGSIFGVLRGSARGSIFNEFLIGPQISKTLKNRVGDAKRLILGAGGGAPPGRLHGIFGGGGRW